MSMSMSITPAELILYSNWWPPSTIATGAIPSEREGKALHRLPG